MADTYGEIKAIVVDLLGADESKITMEARFREELGMPPHEYILRRRIDRAAALLAAGRSSVTEVAYDLGFSSSQYFAMVFKRFTHRTPSQLLARL